MLDTHKRNPLYAIVIKELAQFYFYKYNNTKF